jgi:hypothetical protein
VKGKGWHNGCTTGREEGAGDRFVSVLQIAQILKDGASYAARKVPTRALPNWLIRVVALFDPAVKGVLPELGKHKNASMKRRVACWAGCRGARWTRFSPRPGVYWSLGC